MSGQLTSGNVADLALGSVFLATGGGGDPYLPLLLARAALAQYGSVTLLPPEALPDDAHVVAIGGVGAPTASMELLPSLDESLLAVRAYEKLTGHTVDAIVPFEVGGGNSLLPLVAAAALGVPLVDGDGMGRAFPEAQMMSFAIGGVAATPAVAIDYSGEVLHFDCRDTPTYEQQLRLHTASRGGVVVTAEHGMSGYTLKQTVIPGTLSFACRLGETLYGERGGLEQLLPTLQNLFDGSIYRGCKVLFRGRVQRLSLATDAGFDAGTCWIEDPEHPGDTLELSIRNEYLQARCADRILASVPDLIVLLDSDSGRPVNVEQLGFGQRLTVLALGAPNFFQSEEALRWVAPRCFGLDGEYVPLFGQ
jgi:hypothetical protein